MRLPQTEDPATPAVRIGVDITADRVTASDTIDVFPIRIVTGVVSTSPGIRAVRCGNFRFPVLAHKPDIISMRNFLTFPAPDYTCK